MPSRRQLTVEAALAIVGPHLVITNVVVPWLAEWMPVLALNETESVMMPSTRSLRVRPIGADLADPGLWVYLVLLWLCFGGWVFLRRTALREWGQELLADTDLDA